MSRVLCICATHRDHRELRRIAPEHDFVFHDYASLALEDLTADEAPPGSAPEPIDDPTSEIARLVAMCERTGIEGVFSTDDYPGAALAAIVASQLHLPGPSPAASLLCQHKFYARQRQAMAAPEAVPRFRLIDGVDAHRALGELRLPVFVKPVKSFFSAGAQLVEDEAHLARVVARWSRASAFFRPFEILLRRQTGLELGGHLVAEDVLTGHQCTLEGFAFAGEIEATGIVDSIMFPGTLAFQRFDYPSSLPVAVQGRMIDVARKVMTALGFAHGQFNVELVYEPTADSIHIIEINPRMSSQFADLFEKVDGTNSYSIAIDLALGRRPRVRRRAGAHAVASSCVLRTLDNRVVRRLPSLDEIASLEAELPDIRIEILATEGARLSQQMQDTCSYRYGLLNLGGRGRAEVMETLERCKRRLTFVLDPV